MRKIKSAIMYLSLGSIILVGCGQVSTETVDTSAYDSSTEEKEETKVEDSVSESVATTFVEEEPAEEAEKVADSEDDLIDVLSDACADTLMIIIRDDFDGDGVFEAFAATSKDPYAVYFNDPENASDCYDDTTIWYVTATEATAIEDVPFGPNFVYMKTGVFADGTKAVLVDFFMSNVDTDSYIFTLKDGTYNYLGTHTSASIAEDGLLYSGHFIRDIEANYFETEIYEYSDGELILKDTVKEDA